MATSQINLPKGTWTEVSTVSVTFQLPGQTSALAVEASTAPTDNSIRKKIQPGRIYTFTKLDGNLYMYSPDVDTTVAIDPIA